VQHHRKALYGLYSPPDIIHELPRAGLLGNPHVLFEDSWIAMFSDYIGRGSRTSSGKAVSFEYARRTVKSRI